jgi:hypothetical protein
MDIVYPLGNGSTWDDNELRFSLRSISDRLQNFKNVYVIGHRPKWLKNVIHIPESDPYTCKEANIARKVLRACQEKALSKDFLFMNDDHFLLRESDISIPFWRGPELKDHEAPKNNYQRAVKNTRRALIERGLSFHNFDIHVPIVYNKELFPGVINSFDWSVKNGYVLKSLYCNGLQIPGERLQDSKLNDMINQLKTRDWFSIGPGLLSRTVKEFFSEFYPTPSPFEI